MGDEKINGIKLNEISATFIKESDVQKKQNSLQKIELKNEVLEDKNYYVLSTQYWSFETPEELLQTVKRFTDMVEQQFKTKEQ